MGRRQRRSRPGARRTGAADLLANLCAVMALFPAAGDAAFGEMVAKMKADRAAGAATAKGRRAGTLGRPRRRGRN